MCDECEFSKILFKQGRVGVNFVINLPINNLTNKKKYNLLQIEKVKIYMGSTRDRFHYRKKQIGPASNRSV